MDVFSDKQNYNHVNWNYMAKNRCQHNILQIFREIILFLSFICFKTSMLFGLVSVFRLLPSLTYFFYRFIKYFKLIKYPVNDNVMLTKISQQVYSVKCSSFFSYTAISIPPQTKKNFSIFDQNRLSRRESCTSELVNNNYQEEIWDTICTIYQEEIWDAICTISNSKLGVMGASLNF